MVSRVAVVAVACLGILGATVVAGAVASGDVPSVPGDGGETPSVSLAGSPDWSERYDAALIWDVDRRPGGGYVALGASSVFGLESNGSVAFERRDADWLVMDAEAADDGDLLVAGLFGNRSSGLRAGLLRVAADGTVTERRTYTHEEWGSSQYDAFTAVERAGDGGYVLAGRAGEPETGSVLKVGPDLSTEWQTNASEVGSYAAVAADGDGYVVAGTSGVSALDAAGNFRWNVSAPAGAVFHDVVATGEGYLAVGADRASDRGLVASVAPDGTLRWTERLEGGVRELRAVTVVGNESALVVGQNRTGGDADAWVAVLSTNGTVRRARAYGGSGNETGLAVHAAGDTYLASGLNRTGDGSHGWVVSATLEDGTDDEAGTATPTVGGGASTTATTGAAGSESGGTAGFGVAASLVALAVATLACWRRRAA